MKIKSSLFPSRRHARIARAAGAACEALEDRRLLSGVLFTTTTINVGAGAGAVAVADLGNGHPDLIVANTNGTVSVLLGNGDGTFAAPAVVNDGLMPAAKYVDISVVEINGDADLVVDNRGVGISILVGNNDGTFKAPQTMLGSVESVVVGDFNGDGTPDLAVGYDGGNVVILNGVGDGTFTAGQNIPVAPGSNVTSMISADFNNDGHADLVVGERNGTIYELYGNGNGTFMTPHGIFFPGANGLFTFAASDFAKNNDNDLIVGFRFGQLDHLLSYGDGAFTPTLLAGFPGGIKGNMVATDVNGDGKPDLLVANYARQGVDLFLGGGNSAFFPALIFPVGGKPIADTVGDVNSDGKLDIVTVNSNGTVSVMENTSVLPSGALFNSPTTVATGTTPSAIASAKLGDGSGFADLVVANEADDSISILLGDGTGAFPTTVTYNGFSGPQSLAIADVNGDGDPDIIVGNSNGTITTLLSTGATGFAVGTTINFAGAPTPGSDVEVAAGNFGNGQNDIIATNSSTNQVQVFFGDGTGNLTPHGAAITVGDDPVAVAVSKLTPTTIAGPLDVFVANKNSGTVSVLLNDGTGTFTLARNVFVGERPESVALGDVSGDGRPDLIVGVGGSNYATSGAAVNVLVSNGNGTFLLPRSNPVPGNDIGSVITTDVNLNLTQDIIVTSHFRGASTDIVSVLSNVGNNTYPPRFNYAVDASAASLATGDFNGDGKPDIATVDTNTSKATILLSANGPRITSANNITFNTGTAGLFYVATNGGANTIMSLTTNSRLPAGVKLYNQHDSSASLYGKPAIGTGGVYTITINADNRVGNIFQQTFTLTVTEPPRFTSLNHSTFTNGNATAQTFTITTGGFPSATLTELGSLPNGLIFTAGGGGTATITGTATNSPPGTYALTFSAVNGIGTTATQKFTLRLN